MTQSLFALANLDFFAREQHCRDLFDTPIAA